ncbi:MAG: FAD:protein FMN transferase [Rhodocyclaceae bacterium]
MLAAAVLCLGGCGARTPYQQESYVFGTRVEILIYGAPTDKARTAAGKVLREFDRLHRVFHAWQPSELTQLNDALASGQREIPVSPELAKLLAGAADVAARSDQLFDPALGRLIGLWGFQSDEFKPILPPAADIAALVKSRPTMADISVADNLVSSRNRDVKLDLGGYAKGYALDRAVEILRGEGIANALVNIGGNVMALGDKGGKPWRIGIQHPRQPWPLATLDVRDGEAIGTSGDYQRFFELDGKRYCHILDPRSGFPADQAQAVTILVTPRPGAGTLSDAASKPLFVAGPAGWRDYARRFEIEHALFVDAAGKVSVTRALHQRLQLGDGVAVEVVD